MKCLLINAEIFLLYGRQLTCSILVFQFRFCLKLHLIFIRYLTVLLKKTKKGTSINVNILSNSGVVSFLCCDNRVYSR